MLLTIIGGRIVPAFTRNWLALHRPGEPVPAPFGRVDTVAAVLTGLAGIAWVLAPAEQVTGYLALWPG